MVRPLRRFDPRRRRLRRAQRPPRRRTPDRRHPEPADAGPDVIDATDAAEEPDVIDPFPDAGVVDCQDAGITYIYLISSENELIRFYPPDLSLTTIGTIDCPSASQPFSMAVDRQGVAYVLFADGELFRVSTLTASCKPTSFFSDPGLFATQFGMGFSANTNDPGETSSSPAPTSATPAPPAASAPSTRPRSPSPHRPVEQAHRQPRAHRHRRRPALRLRPRLPESHLAEIDKATAQVKSDVLINLQQGQISAWAFAFWGGDFYFFTSDQPGFSVIHRYTPGATTTPPAVQQINLTIVGAGVSTCAPSE